MKTEISPSAPISSTYIVKTADGILTSEQALGALSTGIMKVTTTTGVISAITNSSGLLGCLSDATGTGAAVFAASPTLSGTITIDNAGAGSDPTLASNNAAQVLTLTGTMAATGFSGPLTGNVTGNCSGTAATVTGAAQAAITSLGTLTGLSITSPDTTTALAVVGDSVITSNVQTISADGLTTGVGLNITSTSTVGGASGASYVVSIARSGANQQLAHTAYGIYATVINTNATSGTNIAGYFSASGATTANYGLIVAAGNVGIGTTAPVVILDVLSATTDQLRLRYDSTHHAGFNVNSAGDISIYSYGTTYRNILLGIDGATQAGNIGIGTATFGTNAVSSLSIANATAPTALVANQIQIYSVDSSDATATLGLFLEQAVEAIGTFTASHKIKVLINGTAYWLQLDAV